MTKDELKWLKKVFDDPTYKIVVDNDSIWVEDTKKDECVLQFNSFGQDFIVDVLNSLGYNTEHC